jgi:hypothetical protein
MSKIKINLNNLELQEDLFSLEKNEQKAFLATLKKIKQLTWEQLYVNKGLHWEMVTSKLTNTGQRIYSFRFSKKYRALALREGEFLEILSLHVDHDSAYQ